MHDVHACEAWPSPVAAVARRVAPVNDEKLGNGAARETQAQHYCGSWRNSLHDLLRRVCVTSVGVTVGAARQIAHR